MNSTRKAAIGHTSKHFRFAWTARKQNAEEDHAAINQLLPYLHNTLSVIKRLGNLEAGARLRPILLRTTRENKVEAFRLRDALRTRSPPIYCNPDLTWEQQKGAA